MLLRGGLRIFVLTVAAAWSVGMTHSVRAQAPAPPMSLDPNFDPFARDDASNDNAFTAPVPQGYFSSGSTVGSIIAVPNLRFPGTVNTVTQQMIRDQQALSFSDILRNFGGAVQNNGGLGHTNFQPQNPDQFLLRGLETSQFSFRKNGFLDPTYTPRDFVNVERVDIVKGPASVLYGAGQPGGTINVVTKKALQSRFAWGGLTFGSDELQRYQFDANSMNAAGDFLIRVNGAYQDGNSFRNFGGNERTFIAPTFTKLLGSDTAITWEGEYHRDLRRPDPGNIAVAGNTRGFSERTFFGALSDFAEFEDYRSTLSLTHRFNDRWQLYLGGSSLFYDAPSRQTIPQTGFTTTLTPQGFFAGASGIGGNLNRSQSSAHDANEQNHAIITDLSGEVDGPLFKHHVLVGTELNWLVVNGQRYGQSVAGLDPALTINPVDTDFQPFPGATPINEAFVIDVGGYYQNRFGLYYQDITQVTDRLTFMSGVRFDAVRAKYDRQLFFGGFPVFSPPVSNETFDDITTRVGATYELVPGAMSLYGLYSESFAPPPRTIYSSAPLEAESGTMWEAGVKTQIYDNLAFTVGAFYIDRDQVAVLIDNLRNSYGAWQRSRGVELNLVGNWTDRLSTVSNYTYADVEQGAPAGIIAPIGRVRGMPFGTGNVWTRYNFIQNRDAVLGLGLGYVYVGDRRGDYATPLRLPSYDRWDLGVMGQYKRWDLNCYVENIFDVRYETSSLNQYQVYPGAPVNFRMQIGVNF